jgi:nicotinamide-nucleotide adenylyltransferase
MKRGIFIGRFQPFHKGHLHVIDEMDKAKDLEEIIIGIGTAQIGHTSYNPFTSDEREKMIRKSVGLKKPYYVVKINDINDYPKWVSYVESLCPKFDVIYAGNTIVKELFEEKGYEVRSPRENYICATEIRQLMLINGNWKDYVPKGTIDVIDDIDGVGRLRSVNSQHINPGVTSDIIVNYLNKGIVFIKRKHEPYKGCWALPGGFMNAGQEPIEITATREIGEEISLDLKVNQLNLLGVYSNPGRDPRGPTVSVVYYVDINRKDELNGELKAADDAAEFGIFKLNEIPKTLAFDHNKIMEDYFKLKK